MKVLIVEDEDTIADRIEKFTKNILGSNLQGLWCFQDIDQAREHLTSNKIDVLLLDLNLNGKDGFLLLQELVSYSFQTIVVSANTDRALEAFQYGVLDFIAKPFSQDRLAESFHRIKRSADRMTPSEFLSIRLQGAIHLIQIVEIQYIQSDHNFSILHLKNGRKSLHDKSLQDLIKLLPSNFIRIHRSFIVDENSVEKVLKYGAGKYEVVLRETAIRLPMSRGQYQAHKERWI